MNTQSRLVPVPTDDGITFKACATELFRWVRAGVDFIEAVPSQAIELAADVQQAWHDSAKR